MAQGSPAAPSPATSSSPPTSGRPQSGVGLTAELAAAGALGRGVTPRTFTELGVFGAAGRHPGAAPPSQGAAPSPPPRPPRQQSPGAAASPGTSDVVTVSPSLADSTPPAAVPLPQSTPGAAGQHGRRGGSVSGSSDRHWSGSVSSVSRDGFAAGVSPRAREGSGSVSSLRTGTVLGDGTGTDALGDSLLQGVLAPRRRALDEETVSSLRTDDPHDAPPVPRSARRAPADRGDLGSVSSLRTDALHAGPAAGSNQPRPPPQLDHPAAAAAGPRPAALPQQHRRPPVTPGGAGGTELTMSTGRSDYRESDCTGQTDGETGGATDFTQATSRGEIRMTRPVSRGFVPALPIQRLDPANPEGIPEYVCMSPGEKAAAADSSRVTEASPPPLTPPPPAASAAAPAAAAGAPAAGPGRGSSPTEPQRPSASHSEAASTATKDCTPPSWDYRDYLVGGRDAAKVYSARCTDLTDGGGSYAARLYDDELRQHLPSPPVEEVRCYEQRLRQKWREIEEAHRALVTSETEFLGMVKTYCDKCAAAQDQQRLERKVAKYVSDLSRTQPQDLPQTPLDPAELSRTLARTAARAEVLHGEQKRMVAQLAADVGSLAAPLMDDEAGRWVSVDHVRLEPFARPVALLEDLNHILTVTNTMRASDLVIQLPEAGATCAPPAVGQVDQAQDSQQLFLDACQAAKQHLETKIGIIEETRSRISADLKSPSRLVEHAQAQLSALLRAVEKRYRGREADERELGEAMQNFEQVQHEKRALLEEKRQLLSQQAADIDRMMEIKRQSLYKDLLDRVKVQAEQSKREQEGGLIAAVTPRVTAAVSAQLKQLRCRRDGIAAARAVALRQGEFLAGAQKYIVSHIGTAMERLHRLAVSAHERCLQVSMAEWQALEVFYAQWEALAAAAQRERGAEAEAAAAAARAQMDSLRADFRRVPEYVWRLRSFHLLADDDPARFADVRSVLARPHDGEGTALSASSAASGPFSAVLRGEGADEQQMLAAEAWLLHVGAVARGNQTPRGGLE
eukprot:TRINITY_DN14146_c0_g1_i1.p1 TRINITY_DN14146_c0_g1~~TRINITY_DN14146_c0_g1_i1.p1  ORF type:complete len:1047 (+),score=310.89 TRINITY_DN14146_c0_g1_i1:80-3142(+)